VRGTPRAFPAGNCYGALLQNKEKIIDLDKRRKYVE